jgi:cytoskeletal protein RodZ
MFFEKKKIKIETLGEYLKEVREDLNLLPKTVAEKTGISLKFLLGLEAGDFKVLPADVYVSGFLKQLGQFYSIEPQILIKQYRKENSILDQLEKQSSPAKIWTRLFFKKVVITPKIFSLAVGLIFVVITISYLIWQVASINKTPSLEIFKPQNYEVIKGSFVLVKGKTDPGIIVTVNEQNVFVDKEGNFTFPLSIAPGTKNLEFTAKNKFDKTITKSISVISESGLTQSQSNLQMELEFTDNVILSLMVDDESEQIQEFKQGDKKNITAKKKIVLSTSDAGATKVILNNQDLGNLGRPKEKLVHIPFFAESGNIDSSNK